MPSPIFISAPYAVGTPRTGSATAPTHIRKALEATIPETRYPVLESPSIQSQNADSVIQTLTPTITHATNDGLFPLICGGDHSISFGSLHAVGENQTLGVVWIDAHADFNTPETSPSGNSHGMVLAGAVGDIPTQPDWDVPGLSEENIALVGTRSVDEKEQHRVNDSDMAMFPANAVATHGIREVLETALQIAGDGVDAVHVSIDIDVFDETLVPGTGTPVADGLTTEQADTIVTTLLTHIEGETPIQSIDLVEVDPTKDETGRTTDFATSILHDLGIGILDQPE